MSSLWFVLALKTVFQLISCMKLWSHYTATCLYIFVLFLNMPLIFLPPIVLQLCLRLNGVNSTWEFEIHLGAEIVSSVVYRISNCILWLLLSAGSSVQNFRSSAACHGHPPQTPRRAFGTTINYPAGWVPGIIQNLISLIRVFVVCVCSLSVFLCCCTRRQWRSYVLAVGSADPTAFQQNSLKILYNYCSLWRKNSEN